MKKQYVIPAVIAALFIGLGAGCACCCYKNKIAVIDVATVVSKSQQVSDLKNEQAAKIREITLWLQQAQENLKNEKDEKKQEELLKQYNEEFAAKRAAIAQDYAERLRATEESINKTIADEAKKNGYKLVLAKAITLYGGDDITEEVAKVIK